MTSYGELLTGALTRLDDIHHALQALREQNADMQARIQRIEASVHKFGPTIGGTNWS